MPRPVPHSQMNATSVPKSGAAKKNKTSRQESRPAKHSSKIERTTACNSSDIVKHTDKDGKKLPSVKQKRRQRENSPVIIEDNIDGFAFTSFKTIDDLEDFVNGVDLAAYDSPCSIASSNSSFASEIHSEDDSKCSSPLPGSSGLVPRASTPYATVESDLPESPSSNDTLESFPTGGTPSATSLSDLPGTPGRGECLTESGRFDHQSKEVRSPSNEKTKVKKDTRVKKSGSRAKVDINSIVVSRDNKSESQEFGSEVSKNDHCSPVKCKEDSADVKEDDSNEKLEHLTAPCRQEEGMDIASPVMDVLRESDSPNLLQDIKPSVNPVSSDSFGHKPLFGSSCNSSLLKPNVNCIKPKEELNDFVQRGHLDSSCMSPNTQMDRENRCPGWNKDTTVKNTPKIQDSDVNTMNSTKIPDVKIEIIDHFSPKCEAFRENNKLCPFSHRPHEHTSDIQVSHAIKNENQSPSMPVGKKFPEDYGQNMAAKISQYQQPSGLVHPTPHQQQQNFRPEKAKPEVSNKLGKHHGNYPPMQSVHLDKYKKLQEVESRPSIIGKSSRYLAADASLSQRPRQKPLCTNSSSVGPQSGVCAPGIQSQYRPPTSSQPPDRFTKPLQPPPQVFHSFSRYHSPLQTATHHVTTATATLSTATPAISSSPKLISAGVTPKSSTSYLNLPPSRPTHINHHSHSRSSGQGHPHVTREQPRPIPGVSGTREPQQQQPKPIPGISSSTRFADNHLLPSFDQIGYQGSSSTYKGATSPYYPYRSRSPVVTSGPAVSASQSHAHLGPTSQQSHSSTNPASSCKPTPLSTLHIPSVSHNHSTPPYSVSSSISSSPYQPPAHPPLTNSHHHIPNHPLPLGPSTSLPTYHHHHHPNSLHHHPLSSHTRLNSHVSPPTPTLSLPSPFPPPIAAPPHISPTLPPAFGTSLSAGSGSFAAPLVPPPPSSLVGSSHAGLGMFAPPLPLALSTAPPVPLPSVPPFGGLDVLANSELHRERLLQEQLGLPPYIRAEMHSHSHQHVHQHNHTHLPGQLHSGSAGSSGASVNPLAPSGGLLNHSLSHLKTPPSSHSAGPSKRPTPGALDTLPTQYDKLSNKLDSSYPFPSAVPGYPNLGPLSGLHSAVPSAALGSGLQGAFQPKTLGSSSSMHPSQMLLSMRDKQPAVAAASPASASAQTPSTANSVKKPGGKWCAAHVRVAWEIHMHQQKQKVEGSRTTAVSVGDFLPPPGHLAPPPPAAGLHRPELANSLLTPGHERSGFDPGHPSHPAGSLLNPARLAGLSPFSRPSPFPLPSLGGAFGAALGGLLPNGLYPPSSAHDALSLGAAAAAAAAGLGGCANPQEWNNRLYRTPPSFPQPPASFSAKLESERESEREALMREREKRQRDGSRERDATAVHRDRERDAAVHRDRELRDKEREREYLMLRRSPLRDHSGRSSLDNLERLRDKERSERHSRDSFPERSRSRSPVRNGPLSMESNLSSSKLDGSVSSHNSTPGLNSLPKLKEERKDEVVIIDDRSEQKPAALANGYKQDRLFSSLGGRTELGYYPPPVSLGNPLDRGRLLPPYGGAGGPLWNYDSEWQRLDLQREFEKQKDSMLSRFTSAEREKLMEYERYKSGLLHHHHIRETGGNPHHSAAAAAALMHHHNSSSSSPLLNNNHHPHSLLHHSGKTGISPITTGISPITTTAAVGIPPPLIPTTTTPTPNSTPHNHHRLSSRSNSPVVNNNKSKPGSPTQSNSLHQPHSSLHLDNGKVTTTKQVLPPAVAPAAPTAVNGIGEQEGGAR